MNRNIGGDDKENGPSAGARKNSVVSAGNAELASDSVSDEQDDSSKPSKVGGMSGKSGLDPIEED